MNSLKQFHVPFVGLKLGSHQFDYTVDHTFFASFPDALIKKGNLLVQLELYKTEQMLTLHFHINGFVVLVCDRCADEYQMPIAIVEQQLVKYNKTNKDTTDAENFSEISYLGSKDHQIDISNLLYEYIHLAVPYVHRHPDGPNGESTCNTEALRVLQKYTTTLPETLNDPRWDALKNSSNN